MSTYDNLLSASTTEEPNPNIEFKCRYNFRKWFSVFISMFSYIFVYLHRFSTAVLSEAMAKDFNVPIGKIGILASMYFWPYGLIQPFIGSLADIIEPGYMIAIANIISAVGALICGAANSLALCCFGRLLVGLGCSAIFVPTNKIGANWFTAREFRFFAGAMIGLGGCGSLLSQTPLSLLGQAIGWRWCLYSCAICCTALGILAAFFVRGHPETLGFRGEYPLQKTPPFKESFIQLFKNLWEMCKIVQFWLLSGFMFFAPGVFMVISSLWGIPYLQHVHRYSPHTASLVQMALSVSLIVGSPLLPVISEMVKTRKWTLFTFCGIAASACIYFALAEDTTPIWATVGLFFIYGFGASACQGTALPLFKEFADNSLAATLVGGGNTGPFIGGAILQSVSSAIFDRYPTSADKEYPIEAYSWGLWGLSAGCCIIAMICIAFVREPDMNTK